MHQVLQCVVHLPLSLLQVTSCRNNKKNTSGRLSFVVSTANDNLPLELVVKETIVDVWDNVTPDALWRNVSSSFCIYWNELCIIIVHHIEMNYASWCLKQSNLFESFHWAWENYAYWKHHLEPESSPHKKYYNFSSEIKTSHTICTLHVCTIGNNIMCEKSYSAMWKMWLFQSCPITLLQKCLDMRDLAP